ncbi:PREDICTED: complement C4-B-like [Thamnophis sirtalis]|uniref:Complement C4-B-like n=1 Tax=Thamnophis sirtalis TaxID=35019 RepID=A0A6I9YAW7_9SAUR|nr:PREDICTED: complement C4-B-like [Thamnophis sirtalis]
MVLSKGDIISVSSIPRGSHLAASIHITPNLMPTFRVVAFYRLGDEIVSNSIWLEVVARCEGKLEIRSSSNVDRLKPQSRVSLTLNTDDKSFVSLSATDAAVYALNGKNRLSQGKVFEAMKSYDLGCTAGGGEDSLGVFADAGLSIRAGEQRSPLRKAHGCEENASRKKRSLSFQQEIDKKGKCWEMRFSIVILGTWLLQFKQRTLLGRARINNRPGRTQIRMEPIKWFV